ncbi:MFS transporter, putative [Trichophyton verrucosum HKI 0517]|uniref:MFS transporter, putative n=1 Tax=Trichophyton verrucosum (strain HKI 0517) TaxID=663202 RepID=D4DB70_TRIVH|nr:MFS transporter, putative [Trichophyton verrucosum HKI 0517]EFE40904.1 MFS transporter, putative [Trichophyton verrucosum HKI 0517]
MGRGSEVHHNSGNATHQIEDGTTQRGKKGPGCDSITRSDGDLSDKGAEDIPPEGGYGWVCVVCACLINANTWGVNSVSSFIRFMSTKRCAILIYTQSYGVFLSYYLENGIFPNTSPIEYAFTGGLSMSCCLLISPLVTHMVHLYGNRAVLNFGVILQTLSFIGASFATQKWHIFLSQGVCFGFGIGVIFVSSVSIIPQWFRCKRSIANSLAAAGSGIGGLSYSLAAGSLIPKVGLGWTFRVLGLCSFAINLVASNLMRDRNKAIGSKYRAFHFPLLKRPEFLFLQAWGMLSLLGYVVILFSLPNFALSIGLSQKQGSIAGALLNLGQALGRPVVGLVSDRYGRLNMAVLFTVFCGFLCLAVWIPSSNMGVLSFFAVIVGTVAGTFWTTIVPVCAEVVGMQELPGGLSITWVAMVPATTVAEPIALVLRTGSGSTGSYLYAQVFAGLVYVVAGLFLLVVRGWKIGDNERIERVAATNTPATVVSTPVFTTIPTATMGDPLTGCATVERVMSRPDDANCPPTGADVKIWSPLPLTRRMVAWKLV